MTEDTELRRVFASLDEGEAEPPSYADRLWNDLESTLERGTETGADSVVVELSPQNSSQRYRVRFWLAATAAGAAAAVAAVAVVPDDSEPIGTTDQPGLTVFVPTTLPVLIDPVEACARYNNSEWSIERLAASDLASADFDAALAAIEQLRLDLEASEQFETAVLTELDSMRGSVLQARIEVDAGELERAGRSIGRFGPVTLPAEATGEARC